MKRGKYKTDIERIFEEQLIKNNISYSYDFSIRSKYGYRLDFAILEKKIAFECDGECWHLEGNLRDKKRDNYFKNRGWKIIRFKGNDIKDNIQTVMEKVIGVIKNEKISVKVTGVAPLLINKYVIKQAGERKKSTQDFLEVAEEKAYRNKDNRLYIPTTNFKAAMIKAATDFKISGKKSYKDYVKAGIFFDSEEAQLTPNEYTIDRRPVVIQNAMIIGTRPRWEKWSAEFIMNVVDDMLDKNSLKLILEAAGKYKGVGSYRPEYGRFIIENFEVIEKEES